MASPQRIHGDVRLGNVETTKLDESSEIHRKQRPDGGVLRFRGNENTTTLYNINEHIHEVIVRTISESGQMCSSAWFHCLGDELLFNRGKLWPPYLRGRITKTTHIIHCTTSGLAYGTF